MVIIGLIIGGILTGQALIHGAGVRATISQLKQYSTATNLFNMKYNAVPGDFNQATNYIAGYTGSNGDGNGLIGNWSSSAGQCVTPYADCTDPQTNQTVEYANYWAMLSLAGLVEANYGNGGSNSANTMTIGKDFPAIKMNSKVGYLAVGNSNDLVNYFELGVMGMFNNFSCNAAFFLNASDAYDMDNKIDDGIANTGFVVARGLGGAGQCGWTTSITLTTNCTSVAWTGTSTPNPYAKSSNASSGPVCNLRVRILN